MPRITVTTDTSAGQSEPAMLVDEHVHSFNLASGHVAAQLVERLVWAIIDAEQRAPAIISPRHASPDRSLDAIADASQRSFPESSAIT